MSEELIDRLINTMERMTAAFEKQQQTLEQLIAGEVIKQTPEVYSPEEFGAITGHKVATVRGWCNFKRINAEKTNVQHGCHKEWRITHEELLRFKREGLLPQQRSHVVGEQVHRTGMV